MRTRSRRRLEVWSPITVLVLGFYALFLVYPLLNLLAQALVDETTGRHSLQYSVRFFGKPYYLSRLLNSFRVTFCVRLLTVTLGTPLAYLFARYRIRGKAILRVLIVLSSMSAPFIGAYSWICSAEAVWSPGSSSTPSGFGSPASTDLPASSSCCRSSSTRSSSFM